MVSNDRFGRDGRPGQYLTKKRFRPRPSTLVAQEHINGLPLPIAA
jgi:hypothetical protein